MAKKTSDGRRHVYLHNQPPGTGLPYDYNETTIYNIIVKAGCCDFKYSPYESKLDIKDQKISDEGSFEVWTTLGHVEVAVKSCDFCRVL